MSENEKRELEEDYKNLKLILNFHTINRHTIWAGKDKEYEEYINAILDEIFEARKKLKEYE